MKTFSCFKPKDPFRSWSKELDKRVAIWAKNFESSFKLLLLGPAGAGKTTIFKQMKIIHFEGFSLEERQQKAKEIRANLLESVRELTACITASGLQINWSDKENQNRLDFINGLNLDDQSYDLYAAKIYDYSKRILTDNGVEKLFNQLNQLSITHRSQYLLNRVDEIRNVNYIPNNDDILQSRCRTSDIQKLEFQVKVPIMNKQTTRNNNQNNNLQQTFCMFDVGGQPPERRKWIQCFDGVDAVMFLIDSSSFDAIDPNTGKNRLRETISLFHEVWTSRFLLNSNFVLLFNKQDILKEKIARGHRIEKYFPEYKLYKFPIIQDRALINKAGEKMNLFRQSSRASATSASSSGAGPTNSNISTSPNTNTNTNNKNINKSNSHSDIRTGSFYVNSNNNNMRQNSYPQNNCSSTSSHNNESSGGRSKSISGAFTGSHLNGKRSKSTCSFVHAQRRAQPNQTKQQQILQPQINDNNNEQANSDKDNDNTNTHDNNDNNNANIAMAGSGAVGAKTKNLARQNTSPEQGNQHHSCNARTNSLQSQELSAEQAYIRARSFIRDKFLQITRQVDSDRRKFSTSNIVYNSRINCVDQPKRNVCYHYTTATDTENIRDLFENLQKMVIKSSMKNLRQ